MADDGPFKDVDVSSSVSELLHDVLHIIRGRQILPIERAVLGTFECG